jgi:hypothetical protein
MVYNISYACLIVFPTNDATLIESRFPKIRDKEPMWEWIILNDKIILELNIDKQSLDPKGFFIFGKVCYDVFRSRWKKHN